MAEHKVNMLVLLKDIGVLKHQKHFSGVSSTSENDHYAFVFELHLLGGLVCIHFAHYVLLKSSDCLDQVEDYHNL